MVVPCIDNELTVYGQLEITGTNRPEHELKMLLNRFLFTPSTWDRKCGDLSGGEKMKLALCSLIVRENTPDMIIADEPTNNLDIASMEILATTLKNYKGTLLMVSHDEQFIHDVGIDRIINLNRNGISENGIRTVGVELYNPYTAFSFKIK